MDKLIEIDQYLLVAINSYHTEWADQLMWVISGKATWIPLYILLLVLLVCSYYQRPSDARYGWLAKLPAVIWILLGFAIAVGGADYISSGIIKHWVCRPRPTHEPLIMDTLHIVNGYRGGMFGFVSSHAANTISCALLFCMIYTRKLSVAGIRYHKSVNAIIWICMMLWLLILLTDIIF